VIYQIRKIIQSFEQNKDFEIHNKLFGQYFEEYLDTYFKGSCESQTKQKFTTKARGIKQNNVKVSYSA
jgi:hypothetical protein